MTDPGTPTEYLYAVDHCRGSLDCFTAYLGHPATPEEHWAGHLTRFRITRRTPKRIYYVQGENPAQTRVAYVDRQKIEADGEVTRGRYYAPDHHLYLTEPPMPEWFAPRRPADPDGQTCRTVDVDGEPVSYRGDGEPLSEEARGALTHVVRAARQRFDAEHADDPPVLATVADAVHAQLTQRGMRGSELAAELGVRHSAVVRLMQHAGTLTVAELAALARWAGLDVVAVPRGGQPTVAPNPAT